MRLTVPLEEECTEEPGDPFPLNRPGRGSNPGAARPSAPRSMSSAGCSTSRFRSRCSPVTAGNTPRCSGPGSPVSCSTTWFPALASHCSTRFICRGIGIGIGTGTFPRSSTTPPFLLLSMVSSSSPLTQDTITISPGRLRPSFSSDRKSFTAVLPSSRFFTVS